MTHKIETPEEFAAELLKTEAGYRDGETQLLYTIDQAAVLIHSRDEAVRKAALEEAAA